jgi:hypothetical protein
MALVAPRVPATAGKVLASHRTGLVSLSNASAGVSLRSRIGAEQSFQPVTMPKRQWRTCMAWKTYYTFENTGATWAKLVLDKGTGNVAVKAGGEVKFNSDVEGSCFGYAYEWARRLLDYQDAGKSKPTKVGGTPLQQLYEMKCRKGGGSWFQQNAVAVPAVVTGGGNRVSEAFRMDDDKMAEKVNTDNIVCIFSIGYHWMGMAVKPYGRFFFDSNYGLISADTLDEYKDLVQNFVSDYDGSASYSKSWDVYAISK